MAHLKTKLWSFEWDDAGGHGMKLFPSEEEFHAFLYNQAVTCDSKRVQRLLSKNMIEEAYLAWREESGDEPFYRYEWNAHELEIPLCASTSRGGQRSGHRKGLR